jgi:hypothetical protein
MSSGALADEFAVQRSPDPLGAIAAAPGFVAGVFALGMVAGVDGEHFDPSFSEILLSSPNWGKILSATVQ